ncbi:hypothetical protein [Clostridium formicaceticum]|uniref:Uncharacterized protein n=1 Tax=Clostridium formicaceticum TaxID=1497 RepID=A0AAC9RIL0_9CLOT|nr:hypothetical protein [Clostridium formicaceticum]AOY77215.1 hypothetical protein BJL90_15975 [Clostridium formicaceticum]ARE87741.1 hypothetical protein CLFO_21410 [Clostridium formicaceticum]
MERYLTVKEIRTYWKSRGYKVLVDIIGIPYCDDYGKIVIYLFGRKKPSEIKMVRNSQIVYMKYEYIFRPRMLYYFYRILRYKLL